MKIDPIKKTITTDDGAVVKFSNAETLDPAQELEARRKAYGFSKKEMAKELCVQPQAYTKWMAGLRTPSPTAMKLARLLWPLK